MVNGARRGWLGRTAALSALCVLLAGCSGSEPESGAADAAIFELAIEGRRVARDGDTIRVRQGQPVELRWSTDEPTTLHLHGYGLELVLRPEHPKVMAFDALTAGRFEINAHGFAGLPRDPDDPFGGAREPAHDETTLLWLEVVPGDS